MPSLIGTMDWNFLLQKLAAVAVWAGTFAFFYRYSYGSTRRPVLILVAFALLTLAGYKAVAHSPTALVSEAALDRYAGYDVSFKVTRDVLAPALDDESYQAFYDFLQQNTSLPESAKVAPIDMKLVDKLKPTTSEKPNIFIFVVDSLRQDYLSPYNHAVTFTPGIESFARESIVMEKAFSRYGGTVLSEPAIWTGSMQLHKQYIQPFYPMNSLQKLVDIDGYDSLITIDPVVEIMLQKSATVTELDKNPSYWTDYDLCRTLKEIETKLDHRKQSDKPLFVYSQPQNLHTVTLFRLGNKRPPTKDYSGFHRLYASEVERMDQAFGEFIQDLKSRGLYDNSIVVLTADHGDSLGEFGRWGHGSTMFPEIVRIPLIVHLPARLQKSLYWDTKQVAFSMDVTPSLYYLLGHHPIRNDEMLGRPLFTGTKEEHDQYIRNAYLLVSSYGPVYARLADNGGSLFIVDAALHKNYLYNLAEDPAGTHNVVSVKNLAENERFIRDHVTSIGKFYKFQQGEVLAGAH
jgi:arylsulfatase A-like enzyme